jgi:GTP pyrophosphokinase
MNKIAEQGFAAHWRYKYKTEAEEGEMSKWIQTIKEILADPQPDAMDFLDTIKLNLFASEIFVFTPKGELKTMPQNSTALDFAFSLDTEIGSHCIGAKVNHKLVPLSHELRSGDQVEILTSKSHRVLPQWETFATTAQARQKIVQLLKQEQGTVQKQGEKMLEEFLEKEGLFPTEPNMEKLCKLHKTTNKEELCTNIGNKSIILGEADKNELKEKNVGWKKFLSFPFGNPTVKELKEEPQKEEAQEKIDTKVLFKVTEETLQKNSIRADCCHPIPGDDILGYLEQDGKVMIHKRQCPVAVRLKSRFGNRIVAAEWKIPKTIPFLETIYIRGIDNTGILNNVTHVLATELNVNIKKITLEADNGIFDGKIQIYVHDTDDVKQICNDLLKISSIKSVTRIVDAE